MPPRAKAAAKDPAEPTRRSTRISSKPKDEEPAPKKAAPRTTKKRAAADAEGGEGDDAPAVKKVTLR